MKRKGILHKSNRKVKLNAIQIIGHYSLIFLPLAIPTIQLFHKLNGNTIQNSFSTNSTIVTILISLIIIVLKYRELYFFEINGKRSEEEFQQAVLATATKLNWMLRSFDSNKIQAIALSKWTNDSQLITIERESNKVLINSMTEINILTLPDLSGKNRRTRETFAHYYALSSSTKQLEEQVISQIRAEKIKEENEPEWNLKNTLKRTIAYVLSLVLWIISIILWYDDGLSFYVALFAILGTFYIVIDMYIIWTKKK